MTSACDRGASLAVSLTHTSAPTRQAETSYADLSVNKSIKPTGAPILLNIILGYASLSLAPLDPLATVATPSTPPVPAARPPAMNARRLSADF